MRRVRTVQNKVQQDAGYEKARPTRKRGKWKRWLAVGGVVSIGLLAAAPTLLLQQRAWLVGQINQRSGLAPIQVDIGPLSGGWIQPFGAQGIRLVDDRGAELVKIGSVETELTLFSLLANYKRLGTITLRDVAVVVDVHPGTTSLEEAIKPLLQSSASTSAEQSPSSSAGFTGRIRIANAVLQARDTVDQTAWALKVSEADVPIPTAEQPIPPMTLVGELAQTSALPGQRAATGQFTLRTEPIAPGMTTLAAANLPSVRMNVSTQGLPLHWMSLVKRRLPDLPIESLDGEATVLADVEYTGPQALTAFVKTAQLDRLRIAAPSLIGDRGAGIEQIRLSGDVSLFQDRISTNSSKLECDFGTLISKANIAIPPKLPSLSSPWLEDSEFEIQGTVDLPRLAAVAPDLLKTQDQVTLLQGNAMLSLSQTRPAGGLPGQTPGSTVTIPSSSYQVKLGNLRANVQGKQIAWDQAFSAGLDVSPSAQGVPSLRLACNSEFCQIEGAGDLLDGRLTAQLDLDKMEQRLSEWFVLPLESLTGSAQAALAWKLNEGNRLAASGSLRTTPIRIVHPNGMLDEPAWDGEFSTVAQLDGATILQLDRVQAGLKSAQESLEFQVLEPMGVAGMSSAGANGAVAASGIAQKPAPMMLKLTGDMDRWQRRGQIFAGVDPGVKVAGRISLDVQGAIDQSHVEVSMVDWTAEPFQIVSGATTLQESRMVGKFQGKFDSSNLANLKVDNLLVRADSFAVQAQDQAVGSDGSRKGQAAFRVDPSRMIASMQSAPIPSPNPNGANPNSNTLPVKLTGDVTGQIDWTLDPSMVQWHMVTQAKDLRAVQPTQQPRNPNQLVSTGAIASNESLLWEEPQVVATVDGSYRLADGLLQLPQVLLQTEWLAYGGATQVTSQGQTTIVQTQGSITYDAARAAERLRPYTGAMLAATGQKTQPLEVTWVNAPNHKWTEALSAKSSIGWDSANVVGIDIGGAEIPLVIENGRFASKAEFPVSQGVLRWNLDGDLVAEPMVIRQTQQRVIENVAITRQMCQGWLKYVTPLLADVTSVQGNLTLDIDRAELYPTESFRQTVEGRLHVHGANVGPGPLADQILNLVTQIRNLRRGAGAADGGGQPTSWLQLPEQNIAFAVDRGRVSHRDMKIQAGDVLLTTSGSVGLDGSLELIAGVPILKEWVDKTPALQPLAGQMIQIPIRGTVARPQLDSSGMIQLGQQLATSALAGAAQKQIDKGLNKLLGPLSNTLGPLQQGGSQLPLPNLPGIPGLQIPGFGAPATPSNAPGVPAPAAPPAGAPAGN